MATAANSTTGSMWKTTAGPSVPCGRASRPGEVYNIGGNCERTNLEVVETICATVDRLQPGLPNAPCTSRITLVKDRRYAIDAGEIQRELGWTPRESFESGLEQTSRWYLDNPAWIERITSGKYQRERLGLGSAAATPA